MFSNVLLAQSTSTHLRLSRLQSLSEWWQWLLLLACCLGVAAYVAIVYRRDSVDLPRGVAWLLLLLRVAAFVGILFFFLDLEKRAERKVVKNSRVVLLIDTSQSMGLQDPATREATRPRIEQVAAELAEGSLIKSLLAQHDVIAYRFDQTAAPSEIAAFASLADKRNEPTEASVSAEREDALRRARAMAAGAAALLVFALLAGLAATFRRSGERSAARAAARAGERGGDRGEDSSWSLLASMVGLLAGLVVLAAAGLSTPDFNLAVTFGLRPLSTEKSTPATTEEKEKAAPQPEEIDWRQHLAARGVETRIGDAVEFIVNKERGGPIAGIVLFSDGGQNAGRQYGVAVAAAQEAGVPIYTVGIGSNKRPMNVRVVDIEAPQRVYPGDSFVLTGILQAFGMEGRTVKVELLSSAAAEPGSGGAAASGAAPDAGAAAASGGEFESEQRVTLKGDGAAVSVKFELKPEEAGRRNYRLRVVLPEPDHDLRDNEKQTSVQVVERKQRVLLIAGGPMREYQFLRNMLYRDKETTVDVILQSGTPGISQESNELLFEFPKDADELFEYDCIVAFDPDWEAFDVEQIKLLERWVAEEAGGLIVLAGPVKTPLWSSRRAGDERMDVIKGLYPVAFYYQGSATLSLGRFGGDRPFPLQFTRDGLDAEFLWLADNASESEQIWSSFDGVFGYYAVKDPKPGARVYARFSDPDTEIDGALPIYMAGQFYGAGRVFFQASGEMWRVRAVNDAYFETFYTKLVRWAAQGRLQRDSSLGVLLVDKDRGLLGDSIDVRAILKDLQRRPLTDPEVVASLVLPDGARTPLKMRKLKDATREGMYGAEFTAKLEGEYRIDLKPPRAEADELLTREVRIRVPALEIENPERNDALLSEIAQKTRGEYFVGLDAASNRSGGGRPLASYIESREQTTPLPGTPDKNFERVLMTWLLALIAGVLCLEWLIRRLSKLA